MRSGSLRHRVIIQKPQAIQSQVSGESTDGWASVATTFASVEPLSGKERLTAEQVQADVTHRIIMRYRGEFDPTYRISFRGRVFHVESVINRDERNRSLELLAVEEVP